MSGICRDLDDFVHGSQENETDNGILGKLGIILDEAAKFEAQEVWITIRAVHSDTSTQTKPGEWSIDPTKQGKEAIADALRKNLEDNPGPAFQGRLTVEFWFTHKGRKHRLGSFERFINTLLDAHDAARANPELIVQYLEALIAPMVDTASRALSASSDMVVSNSKAVARLFQAIHHPPGANQGNEPLLNMLGHVVGLAGADSRQAAAFKTAANLPIPKGPAQLPGLTLFDQEEAPLEDNSGQLPKPPQLKQLPETTQDNAISIQDVERWADNNPSEAMALIARKRQQFGI